jgi:hypothetical protein
VESAELTENDTAFRASGAFSRPHLLKWPDRPEPAVRRHRRRRRGAPGGGQRRGGQPERGHPRGGGRLR